MKCMTAGFSLCCLLGSASSLLTSQKNRSWRRRDAPLSWSSITDTSVDATKSSVPDEFRAAISKDGMVSAKAIVTSTMLRDITQGQEALPLAAAALGRAITCCLLMADGLKQEETFQVRFQGDGPLNGVLAVANGRLEARGMCGNPKVSLPPNSKGKLDVGAGVGKGNLFVVRAKMLPGDPGPSPYSSVTEIRSGEVPEDINYYLAESEQREGALAAGVYVDKQGVVDAAGGWTVQLLPGATDEVAERLMANLEAMSDQAPTAMIQAGMGPTEVLDLILDGMEPQYFESRTPTKTPNCCNKEKVMRTINLLPVREVVQIVENNEEVSVKCEFCGKVRTLEKEDIKEALERRLQDSINSMKEKEEE